MEGVRIKEINRTCLACPSQWEGEDVKGRYIYIRFRHGTLSLCINDIDNVIYRKQIQKYGTKNDGYIEIDEVLELIPFLSKEG